MTIKKKIHWSFIMLMSIFVINGIVVIGILSYNKGLSKYLSTVSDPSLDGLHDLRKTVIQSRMFATNWVFFRSDNESKNALRHLQHTDFPVLKTKLAALSEKWYNQNMADSLKSLLEGIEQTFQFEEYIMTSLEKFEDYDDLIKKFSAEEQLETVIIPRSIAQMNLLNTILFHEQNVRVTEQSKIDSTTKLLEMLISILAVIIVLVGILLSIRLTRTILIPINKIIDTITDLGKGITREVDYKANGDEIGKMVHSANNLSDKLATTAAFAYEIGNSNFDTYFEPLSSEDTLGIALITMRNNIKTNNESLQANNAQLQKTNAELDKFVYSVSHDLRAPLSSMLGVVTLSEEETEDPMMHEHLNMLKGSIKRLDGFIMDILDYSRNARTEVKKEEINFKEMMGEITENLKYMGAANKKVEIKADIGNGVAFHSDKNRLTVVLNNLISNAIRYQNPGIADPFVNIKIDLSDTEATIVIKDNGIGISKENQEKIFDMFYRVSEGSIGSGLGLYIVKEAIVKLNGNIEVESEPGKGTSFRISIPNN